MLRAMLWVAVVVLNVPYVSAAPLKIATFNVDATPPIGSPVAYAPCRSIEDPLSARGIVIIGEGKPIVLCAVDWIGIANESHDAWRAALATAAGTTSDRVTVHALHQHDGVRADDTAERKLAALGKSSQHFDPVFLRGVIERVGKAVRTAAEQPHEATHLGIGSARVEQAASNRRLLGPNGKVKYVRFSASRIPEAIAAPEGCVDPLVRVLSFWNGDKPLAVISYYATHPQSYYGKGDVTAEWVGLARAVREAELPGVPHIHFNGASGNVAAGKYNDGSPERRPLLRDRLAAGMKAAFEATQKQPITAGDVGWRVESVVLPPSQHLERAALDAELTDPASDARKRLSAASHLAWLDRCQAGHKIDLACLRLGAASVVHMPGELFIEYQLAAQAHAPHRTVCMAAYGDYGMGYIGTAIAYTQGGYEVGRRISLVSPGVESILHKAMIKLLADTPDDKLFESTVFTSGQDGYTAYRIPSIVVTLQGTLLAFCEGRKTSFSDDGDNDMILRRSFDGGRTWQPTQLVHEEGGDAVITIGNPCPVVDVETGAVWLTMNRKNGRVLVTCSRDDGETWSPVKDISESASQSGWGWYANGPGVGIQLSRGKHKGRLVIPANHRLTPNRSGPSASHVFFSDDHGETWQLGGTVGLHTNECQLAELEDGTLVLNARNHWARSGGKPELALKRVVSRSTDGGSTWSEPTFDDALIEPTCQASLMALNAHSATGPRRLVFANPASTKGRVNMTVRASDDGGRTWPVSRLIYEGPSAYSCLTELPLGRIGLVYERDGYKTLTFASFTLK